MRDVIVGGARQSGKTAFMELATEYIKEAELLERRIRVLKDMLVASGFSESLLDKILEEVK